MAMSRPTKSRTISDKEKMERWIKALAENVRQLKEKKGKYYMRWKRGMEAYLKGKGEKKK